MQTPEPAIEAALTAASSPDWAVRARAGEQFVRWADRPAVADVLLRLLLDPQDTTVTVTACEALLKRNDDHALRLIARAFATADSEHLDHLYSTLVGELIGPGGTPLAQFIDTCSKLSNDPDLITRAGATELLKPVRRWVNGQDNPNKPT